MDIVVCTDNNYVMPTGVMFHSICKHNQDIDITFHVIIDKGVTKENQDSLKKVLDGYTNSLHIIFYVIDGDKLSNLPCLGKNNSKNYITQATYYRLFLTEILPKNLEKVLYLDVDMIVRGSLADLWNTDLGEYGVGVIPDAAEVIYGKYYRLHYSILKGYFNAGVLLINLKKWRQSNMLEQFVHFMESHSDWIKYHDQDVLNRFFCDDKMILSIKYNFQEGYLWETPLCDYWKYEKDILEARKNPVIIHYTDIKPWWSDCKNPLRNIFLQYRSETIWRSIPVKKRHIRIRLVNDLKDMIKYILVFFKLRPLSSVNKYVKIVIN